MKFKDWLQEAQKLLKEKPELGDLEVYFAKDDEGNGFNRANIFSYCQGMVEKTDYHIHGFKHEQDLEYYKEEDEEFTYKSNIIVIWP